MSKEIHIIAESDYDLFEIEAVFEDRDAAIAALDEMNRRVPGQRYVLNSYEISDADTKILDYYEARAFSDNPAKIEWLAKGKSSFCFSDTEGPEISIDAEDWWKPWANSPGRWAVRVSGSDKAEVSKLARKRAKELKDTPAPIDD